MKRQFFLAVGTSLAVIVSLNLAFAVPLDFPTPEDTVVNVSEQDDEAGVQIVDESYLKPVSESQNGYVHNADSEEAEEVLEEGDNKELTEENVSELVPILYGNQNSDPSDETTEEEKNDEVSRSVRSVYNHLDDVNYDDSIHYGYGQGSASDSYSDEDDEDDYDDFLKRKKRDVEEENKTAIPDLISETEQEQSQGTGATEVDGDYDTIIVEACDEMRIKNDCGNLARANSPECATFREKCPQEGGEFVDTFFSCAGGVLC